MKLVYKGHPPVQIDKGKFTVLATNNRKTYFELIRGLQGFNDRLTILDDDYQDLDLKLESTQKDRSRYQLWLFFTKISFKQLHEERFEYFQVSNS